MVWMNERRQIKIYKTLNVTKEDLVQNVDPFDPKTENDMNVVHMQGSLSVKEDLEDKTFKLKFPNAIKMSRTVEMFQWKEVK
jgi:hypothetical protein